MWPNMLRMVFVSWENSLSELLLLPPSVFQNTSLITNNHSINQTCICPQKAITKVRRVAHYSEKLSFLCGLQCKKKET